MQRSVVSFGLRMWRRCASAFALSYKKVTRGSEFLPGYAMQAPGLVDLKRRRRIASRVLLSDTSRGDTTKAHSRELLPSPEHGQDNVEVEPCAGDVIVAEPAPSGSEP